MDLLLIKNSAEVIAGRTAAIREAMLRYGLAGGANFEGLEVDDLTRMLELYDRLFLDSWLAGEVVRKTGSPLMLRVAGTMTRAGGKTFTYRRRHRGGGESVMYEIAIASRMLLRTFQGAGRVVTVCGLTCRDRLDALQRIMEHEIIHLVELLVWDESSCAGIRFNKLARNIFGHTGTRHALVTPGEDAEARHGIRVGTMVEFAHGLGRYVGRVNRINQRATVLVEDKRGRRYSDGRKYAKFYVALERLRVRSSEFEGGKADATTAAQTQRR